MGGAVELIGGQHASGHKRPIYSGRAMSASLPRAPKSLRRAK